MLPKAESFNQKLMGREIEIKIPLTDTEYDRLLSFVNGSEARELCHILKSDRYYSRYSTEQERRAAVKAGTEPNVIRIRTEKDLQTHKKESYFCYKFKTVENGVEFNSENETFVQDGDVLGQFFVDTGYTLYFEKRKDAWSVYCGSEPAVFHLELEIVNGLKYVEIEVTQSSLPADEVRQALEDFVTLLKLDVSKRDSRSWMEITGAL